MRRRIYRELDPRLERAAEVQMLAHLNKLVEERRVEIDGEKYRLI
ncbi:MAG: hypothetical protein ACXVJO_13540 [Thermoanaerobaculia bacterium]